MMSLRTRNRRRAASAFSTPAFGSRPVVATPLPSAHSDFSLKIGRGERLRHLVDDEADGVRSDIDDRNRLPRARAGSAAHERCSNMEASTALQSLEEGFGT